MDFPPLDRFGYPMVQEVRPESSGSMGMAGEIGWDPVKARAWHVAQRLWANSQLKGPAPRLNFDGVEPPFFGMVQTGFPQVIHTGRHVARNLTHTDPNEQSEALRNLLHEMAHTRQPPDLTDEQRRLNEGGAEAYSRLMYVLAARAAGLPARPRRSNNYPDEVRRVMAEKGRGWVTRDQFEEQR